MKVKKKTLKKILFISMLLLTLTTCFSMIFGTVNVFATEEMIPQSEIPSGFGILMSGLAWVITIIPRLLLLLFGFFIKVIMSAAINLGTASFIGEVTIENVLFAGYPGGGDFKGGIAFCDVNFFDLQGLGAIVAFRTAVAKWYYILRLISAAILLVILIYVGIRMALSTIAQEQAKYKQMLVDWVTSIALLFLLHYIIIFIISINSSLVNALGSLVSTTGRKNSRRAFEYTTGKSNLG